jgi:hypothetical protein
MKPTICCNNFLLIDWGMAANVNFNWCHIMISDFIRDDSFNNPPRVTGHPVFFQASSTFPRRRQFANSIIIVGFFLLRDDEKTPYIIHQLHLKRDFQRIVKKFLCRFVYNFSFLQFLFSRYFKHSSPLTFCHVFIRADASQDKSHHHKLLHILQ